MAVFRLTDVADRQRESKAYWDQRVAEHWEKPFHGVYLDAKDVVEKMDATNWRVLASLLDKADIEQTRVLECACGYGRYARFVEKMCGRYVGIDLADKSIVQAKQVHADTSCEFHVADMATFQSAEKFDLIFMVAAWSSIEQRSAEVIAHLKTLLAPGGVIAIFEETLYMVIEESA